MVQNREGLGKPLFPSPPLLHLPAFARHFWVANVKPTVFAPLYVTLSTFPPPPSNWVSRAGIVFCYYLTSELHILEFMCLTSPVLVWASRSVVSKSCCHCEGLRSAALDSWEWWQPRNKDTRPDWGPEVCIISTCHTHMPRIALQQGCRPVSSVTSLSRHPTWWAAMWIRLSLWYYEHFSFYFPYLHSNVQLLQKFQEKRMQASITNIN